MFEGCKKRHTLIKDLDPSDVQEISCSGNELSLSFTIEKGPGWRMKKRRQKVSYIAVWRQMVFQSFDLSSI